MRNVLVPLVATAAFLTGASSCQEARPQPPLSPVAAFADNLEAVAAKLAPAKKRLERMVSSGKFSILDGLGGCALLKYTDGSKDAEIVDNAAIVVHMPRLGADLELNFGYQTGEHKLRYGQPTVLTRDQPKRIYAVAGDVTETDITLPGYEVQNVEGYIDPHTDEPLTQLGDNLIMGVFTSPGDNMSQKMELCRDIGGPALHEDPTQN